MTDAAEHDATADADDVEGDDGAAGLAYGDVHAFVEGWFAPTISRPLGGTHRWCPSWWDHPEAELRLDALWRAYEHLQGDPDLGPITFLTHHLDPTLAVLLAPTGPFARCTPDRHEPHQPLPTNPAPHDRPAAEPPAPATQAPGLTPPSSAGPPVHGSGPRAAPPSARPTAGPAPSP